MPLQPSFTLGIEEELQVIDPETRELKSRIHQMFAVGETGLTNRLKERYMSPSSRWARPSAPTSPRRVRK